MAAYNVLKESIKAVIRENGNNEITGPILQQTLLAMVNSLGSNYQYVGIADPTTNPGTPDQNVFYLASAAGTYANFDNLVLSDGEIAILKYNGAWSKDTTGAASLEKVTAIEDDVANISDEITEILGAFSLKADKDADAVAGNLAEFDGNGNPVDSGIPSTKIGEIEDKITALGNPAGIAEGIADSISAGTPQEIVFRKSGGDGVNYMKAIKGKTLAWNQLVRDCSTKAEVYGITRTKVNNYTIHYSGTSTNTTGFTGTDTNIDIISGHKYYVAANGAPSNCPIRTGSGIPSTVSDIRAIVIANLTTNQSSLGITIPSGTSIDNDVSFVCIDLTLMFGAGHEPSSVEEFEALFPLSYYEYNAGTLISNDAEALETVGFNQWDEEWELGGYSPSSGAPFAFTNRIRSKNYISIIKGSVYYCRGALLVFQYDAQKNFLGYDFIRNSTFTPQDSCAFIQFSTNPTVAVITTYNHDICINISDASKNGTYEPYWKRIIELNLSTLKDKDGNLVFPYAMNGRGDDFDKILPDANGQMTIAERVWDRRAYQSGDEDDATVITDGRQYTFVKLATPVVSELAEPIPNAILVDELGTERAIFPEHEDGTPSAPLCTNSNYSISVKNLVSKLASI